MDIAGIREQLTRRKQELQQRGGSVDRDLRRENEALVADFADQATQRQNDEVLSAIGMSAAQELQQIDLALQRLQAGTYGSCQRCGKPIAPARLAAVPYASSCAGCAA